MKCPYEPDVVGADRDQVSMSQYIAAWSLVKPVKPVKWSYFERAMFFLCAYFLATAYPCSVKPVKRSYFKSAMFFLCACFLAIAYPSCLVGIFKRRMKMKKTSAYNSIMIMSTDEGDTALKIAMGKRYDKWVDVKPHPRAFVIKKGNQLQVITDGASAKDIKKILCAVRSALKEKNSYLGWETFGTLDPLPGEPSGSNFGGIIFCAPVSGSSSISSRVWILDTGATHHVCSSPSSFQYLDLSVNSVVTVANGQTVSVAGIGSVRLSDHLTLENVLFVPEFHLNVVSVSALTQQHHYTAIFTSDYYVILDLSRGQIILLGRRSGNLYVLN